MQRIKFISPILISFFCLLATHLALASTTLNGVALHTELGKDQFIAGLFVNTPSSDARAVLLADEPKRIEIRALPEKMQSRRFKRMWIEGMAINASSLELTQQAQNMADFSNMLKIRLLKGDILSVERRNTDVVVKLNSVKLGSIQDKTFFDLLLRTWIGPVPLSSAFRNNILSNGNVDKELIARFNATIPTEARIRAVRNTTNDIQAKKLADAGNTTGIKPDVSIPKPKIDKPIIVPPAPKPTIASTKPAPEPKLDPEPAKPTPKKEVAKAELKTKTDDRKLSKPTPKQAPEKTPSSLDDAISALLGEEAPLRAEQDDEGDEDSFTAESLLTQTMYIARLQKWTYQYLRYPQRAVSRGQEGNVRLKVSISREGKVTNIVVLEESEFNSLTNEARRAVKRASPFPAVPDSVPGDPYNFTLPIAFKLQ